MLLTAILETLSDKSLLVNSQQSDHSINAASDNTLERIINFALFQPKLMEIYHNIKLNGISQQFLVDLIQDTFTIILSEDEASSLISFIVTIQAL